MIKRFICRYQNYVVVEDKKGNFVNRRLYSFGNGNYYYILDGKKNFITESQMHW